MCKICAKVAKMTHPPQGYPKNILTGFEVRKGVPG